MSLLEEARKALGLYAGLQGHAISEVEGLQKRNAKSETEIHFLHSKWDEEIALLG